ncbi:MAG: hypothetical protein GY702_13375 [Desulfobulbaceae bacterium]|nr:hypothetical protein [Desulfobulbaceae bacterium]
MRFTIDDERRSEFDRRQLKAQIAFHDGRTSKDRREGAERRNVFVQDKYLRSVLDAFPSPVLIVDHHMQILDANSRADELIDSETDFYLHRLCGDLLHCLHAKQSEGGCGTTEHCPDCVLRQTVNAVAAGEKTFRRISQLNMEKHGKSLRQWFLISGSEFEYMDQKNVILTMEDVTEIVELRRLIPICANCKKVRDDNNYWQEVEKYLDEHTGVQFSHGICPECVDEMYGGQDWYEKRAKK